MELHVYNVHVYEIKSTQKFQKIMNKDIEL
jgi:hypothetical protein